MSEQMQDDESTPEFQALTPSEQAAHRQRRKAEAENVDLKAQLAQIERERAFEQAGITNGPQRELLMRAYDGPLEADAIKAEAERYWPTSPQPTTDGGPTAEEVAAQRQILGATGGAPAASGDIDLGVALRNAKNEQEVLAIVAQVQGTPGFKNVNGLIGVLPEN